MRGGKKSSLKREIPPALEAFRIELTNPISEFLGKGGRDAMILASSYKKEIEASHPELDAMATIKKARALFDKEKSNKDLVMERHAKAKKESEKRSAEKKAKKAAKKAAKASKSAPTAPPSDEVSF